MSNNLMQIYSAGEFSDDCCMQIQPRLFQQRLKELELPIKFYIIRKTLVWVGGIVISFSWPPVHDTSCMLMYMTRMHRMEITINRKIQWWHRFADGFFRCTEVWHKVATAGRMPSYRLLPNVSQPVWEEQVSGRLLHQRFSAGQCPSLRAEHINSAGTSITAASRHIDQLISWT